MIDELRWLITEHERTRPRSLQKDIGPSEAGHECDRRLAYRMLEVDPVNTDSDPWAAIVGTSVHDWLDRAFDDRRKPEDQRRWATSLKVELTGYMRGTIDLYDTATSTVIDHKVVGPTALKRYRADGPSQQYRRQVHLYGCGLRLAGYDVRNVGIAFWSRSGQLKDSFYWSEPYDEAVVEDVLRRLDAIKATTTALGTAALPLVRTADAYCMWCPFYLPAVTDVTTGCPGHRAEAPTAAPAA